MGDKEWPKRGNGRVHGRVEIQEAEVSALRSHYAQQAQTQTQTSTNTNTNTNTRTSTKEEEASTSSPLMTSSR
jgi:carbohydrate-binding DOMON domain-containing protein